MGAHGGVGRRHALPALRGAAPLSLPLGQQELADIDAVFAALAHATRRHILLVLHARGGAMTAGALAARFSCAWPTTTRHLNVLATAGLVRVEQRGRERWYELDRHRLITLTGRWLEPFMRE